MMHRHDESRAGGVRHLDCLLGCAMRSDPRIVCADGHDREIDGAVLTQVGKTVRQRRVPSEKNAPSISLQKIAVVTAVSVALLPRAPVVNAEGDDVDVTYGPLKRFPFAPTKLRDVAQTCPSQLVLCFRSSYHARILVKAIERSQIEMIKVGVRQKDDVDLGQLMEFKCGRGQSFRADGESRESNPDAREKDGVGENLDAEKIDEHRCMTDPGQRYSRVIPLPRLRFGKSWSNRAPAFHRPFTPKMAKPTTDARTAQSWLVSCFH
jgi:hypothetical protein